MRHSIIILSSVMGCAMLTSCFKDEPLNSECDIQQAYVHLDDPLVMFPQVTDTLVNVLPSNTDITFYVNEGVDMSRVAPMFTLTPGATVSPASGTELDFSAEQQHVYTVTSEDGNWTRKYTIDFKVKNQGELPLKYSFENYEAFAESGVEKYYVWYDYNSFGSRVDCWASGNAGFKYSPDNSNKKPDEYPTVPMADGNGPLGAASGKYLKLETKYTGDWGKGVKRPIAAGNMFIGEFDATKALTATMMTTRFGKPFNRIPKRFKGWYKYSPAAVVTNKKYQVVDGAKDKGAIYAVLYRNHDDAGNAFVLNGGDVKKNKYIVAIADMGDIDETPEWTQFDIPFVYKDGFDTTDPEFLKQLINLNGYSIVIVASSSKDGDLFIGAVGSTLYVDEFELECE